MRSIVIYGGDRFEDDWDKFRDIRTRWIERESKGEVDRKSSESCLATQCS